MDSLSIVKYLVRFSQESEGDILQNCAFDGVTVIMTPLKEMEVPEKRPRIFTNLTSVLMNLTMVYYLPVRDSQFVPTIPRPS